MSARLFLVLLLGAQPLFAQSSLRPLEITDAVSTRTMFSIAGAAAFSRDGARLAYTVCDQRKVRVAKTETVRFDTPGGQTSGCSVWVSPTGGGPATAVCPDDRSCWAPAWSPDGKRLAFYSDDRKAVHVWLWDSTTGAGRQLGDAAINAMFGEELPIWTADGRHVVSKVVPERKSETGAPSSGAAAAPVRWAAPPGKDSTVEVSYAAAVRPGGSGDKTEHLPDTTRGFQAIDLARIDTENGSIRRLAEDAHVANYWLSPDGRWLAFTDNRGRPYKGAAVSRWDLNVVELATGHVRRLADKLDQFHGESVRWAPDSRSLAYYSGLGDESGASCFVVTVADARARRLSGADDFGTISCAVPLWDARAEVIYALDGQTLWRGDVKTATFTALAKFPDWLVYRIVPTGVGNEAWSADAAISVHITATDRVTRRGTFLRVDAKTGEVRVGRQEDMFYGGRFEVPAVSPDGRLVAYVGQSAQHPDEVWLASADFKEARQLTNINPELDVYQFGTSRVVDFRNLDGEPLKAALLLPAGYVRGRRYPLMVWVYASEMGSRLVYSFGLTGYAQSNMQMLATRGYAVLFPDVPVHTGTPVQDLVKCVLPAIDRVVELGIADPDRLAVTGVSNGGYSTLALITQTTRFKAAVMNAGFGELASFFGYGWSAWLEHEGGAMGAAPWENPQRYVQNSPVYYLDRVQTPLLIVAGGADKSFLEPSEQIFTDMQRLGKEATFLRYEGEGHGLKSYANLVDFWNRIVPFLDHYLKAPSELSAGSASGGAGEGPRR